MDEFCKLNPGFDSDAIKNAMAYAADCHNGTNHKYDNHPYTIHLKMVYDFGCKFAHLLNADEVDTALAACWTHDTIEDTRQTYNDVKKRCGEAVAEAVYAVTNEKGRSRAERANDKYYKGIRENEIATFVKLCDRLANATYSRDCNQRMLDTYRNELPHFCQTLFNERFKPMFEELEKI